MFLALAWYAHVRTLRNKEGSVVMEVSTTLNKNDYEGSMMVASVYFVDSLLVVSGTSCGCFATFQFNKVSIVNPQ